MSGQAFGHYVLLDRIGAGGMGEVWRARDTRKDREIALKLLGTWLTADPDYAVRFRREAALAARLNAPSIIPIHDYGEIDGRLFIDMPLVEGSDLESVLRHAGPLSLPRAISVVEQVADALDTAHEAGLIHRDVKPSNVLLTTRRSGRDVAYLIDFGIARPSGGDRLTTAGRELGTLAYMAPERLEGSGDHRGDIYALACVLFQVLTGHQPFRPADAENAMVFYLYAHLHSDPPRASSLRGELPAGIDEVIARGMAKDPAQRYDTAGALALAARAAAEDGPSSVRPSGSWRTETGDPPIAAPAPLPTGDGVLPRADTPRPDGRPPTAPDPVASAHTTQIPAHGPHTGTDAGAPGAPAGSRTRRRTRVGAVIGAVVVLSLAGAGIAVWPRGGSGQPIAGAPTTVTATAAPTTQAPAPAPPRAPALTTTFRAGGSPIGLAVTPDGSRLLSTSKDGATLTVVDTRTRAVVSTVKVGPYPQGLAVTPDGRYAYVADTNSASVSVVDIAAGAVTATVKVGLSPAGVAITPDGTRAYVTNGDSDSVSVIDTARNAVVATVATPQFPAYGVAVAAGGRRVYVANSVKNTVMVIDTASNAIVATIPVGDFPYGMAAATDGRHVYVTNQGGTLSVIDAESNAVTATVETQAVFLTGVAAAPDGRVWVNSDGDSLVVVDVAGSGSVERVKVGDGATGIAVAPDGRTVYVATDDVGVAVVDAGST